MSGSVTRVRGELPAGHAGARRRSLPGVDTGSHWNADYWLAIVTIVVCLGALIYVHCCWPGPPPYQQVFASTAGPAPAVRWNALAQAQCPHCGGEAIEKADRCTHCGRCFAWTAAPCPACGGAGHIRAASSTSPLGHSTLCVCPACCGDGLLGNG